MARDNKNYKRKQADNGYRDYLCLSAFLFRRRYIGRKEASPDLASDVFLLAVKPIWFIALLPDKGSEVVK